jgi:hypothetical protein
MYIAWYCRYTVYPLSACRFDSLDDGENPKVFVLYQLSPPRVACKAQASGIAHQEPPSVGLLDHKRFHESPQVGPVAQQHLHGPVVGLEHVVGAVDHCVALSSNQCQLLLSLIPEVVGENGPPAALILPSVGTGLEVLLSDPGLVHVLNEGHYLLNVISPGSLVLHAVAIN